MEEPREDRDEEEFVLDLIGWVSISEKPIETKCRMNLLSVCNKYGHVAVGTSSGFALLALQTLADKAAEGQFTDRDNPEPVTVNCRQSDSYPGVYVDAPGTIWVAFSCDGEFLAVANSSAVSFYNHKTLASGTVSPMCTLSYQGVLKDLKWNPAVASVLALLTAEGQAPCLMLLEIIQGKCAPYMETPPCRQPITSVSWTYPTSKGSQLVCGLQNGELLKLKLNKLAPAGFPFQIAGAKDCIPGYIKNRPDGETAQAVTDVAWLEAKGFLVIHEAPAMDGEMSTACSLSRMNKANNNAIEHDATWSDFARSTNEDEITSETPSKHYVGQLTQWNIAVVSSMNSDQIILCGKGRGGKGGDGLPWQRCYFGDDGYRCARLPNNDDDELTRAVGLDIDLTNTFAVKTPMTSQDGDPLPPGPRVLLLGNDGRISMFHLANKRHNSGGDYSEYCLTPGSTKYSFMVAPSPLKIQPSSILPAPEKSNSLFDSQSSASFLKPVKQAPVAPMFAKAVQQVVASPVPAQLSPQTPVSDDTNSLSAKPTFGNKTSSGPLSWTPQTSKSTFGFPTASSASFPNNGPSTPETKSLSTITQNTPPSTFAVASNAFSPTQQLKDSDQNQSKPQIKPSARPTTNVTPKVDAQTKKNMFDAEIAEIRKSLQDFEIHDWSTFNQKCIYNSPKISDCGSLINKLRKRLGQIKEECSSVQTENGGIDDLNRNIMAAHNFKTEIEFLSQCGDGSRHHQTLKARPLDPSYAKKLRDLEQMRDSVVLSMSSVQRSVDDMINQHQQSQRRTYKPQQEPEVITSLKLLDHLETIHDQQHVKIESLNARMSALDVGSRPVAGRSKKANSKNAVSPRKVLISPSRDVKYAASNRTPVNSTAKSFFFGALKEAMRNRTVETVTVRSSMVGTNGAPTTTNQSNFQLTSTPLKLKPMTSGTLSARPYAVSSPIEEASTISEGSRVTYTTTTIGRSESVDGKVKTVEREQGSGSIYTIELDNGSTVRTVRSSLRYKGPPKSQTTAHQSPNSGSSLKSPEGRPNLQKVTQSALSFEVKPSAGNNGSDDNQNKDIFGSLNAQINEKQDKSAGAFGKNQTTIFGTTASKNSSSLFGSSDSNEKLSFGNSGDKGGGPFGSTTENNKGLFGISNQPGGNLSATSTTAASKSSAEKAANVVFGSTNTSKSTFEGTEVPSDSSNALSDSGKETNNLFGTIPPTNNASTAAPFSSGKGLFGSTIDAKSSASESTTSSSISSLMPAAQSTEPPKSPSKSLSGSSSTTDTKSIFGNQSKETSGKGLFGGGGVKSPVKNLFGTISTPIESGTGLFPNKLAEGTNLNLGVGPLGSQTSEDGYATSQDAGGFSEEESQDTLVVDNLQDTLGLIHTPKAQDASKSKEATVTKLPTASPPKPTPKNVPASDQRPSGLVLAPAQNDASDSGSPVTPSIGSGGDSEVANVFGGGSGFGGLGTNSKPGGGLGGGFGKIGEGGLFGTSTSPDKKSILGGAAPPTKESLFGKSPNSGVTFGSTSSNAPSDSPNTSNTFGAKPQSTGFAAVNSSNSSNSNFATPTGTTFGGFGKTSGSSTSAGDNSSGNVFGGGFQSPKNNSASFGNTSSSSFGTGNTSTFGSGFGTSPKMGGTSAGSGFGATPKIGGASPGTGFGTAPKMGGGFGATPKMGGGGSPGGFASAGGGGGGFAKAAATTPGGGFASAGSGGGFAKAASASSGGGFASVGGGGGGFAKAAAGGGGGFAKAAASGGGFGSSTGGTAFGSSGGFASNSGGAFGSGGGFAKAASTGGFGSSGGSSFVQANTGGNAFGGGGFANAGAGNGGGGFAKAANSGGGFASFAGNSPGGFGALRM